MHEKFLSFAMAAKVSFKNLWRIDIIITVRTVYVAVTCTYKHHNFPVCFLSNFTEFKNGKDNSYKLCN